MSFSAISGQSLEPSSVIMFPAVEFVFSEGTDKAETIRYQTQTNTYATNPHTKKPTQLTQSQTNLRNQPEPNQTYASNRTLNKHLRNQPKSKQTPTQLT